MLTLAPLITALEGSLTVPTMLPVSIVVWASTGEARLDSEQASKNVKATTLHERSDACDGADIFFATDTARMVASLSCEKNRTKH